MDFSIIIVLFAAEAAAIFILWVEGLLRPARVLVPAVIFLTAAFALRAFFMPYETLDWINFLSVWVERFRESGGFSALAVSIGNYNVPYLYFLALFSYSDINALYLIKLLSIIFDIVLAWASMRLVGVCTNSVKKRIFAFIAVLLLPTVMLNGSLWGQCDSIYTSFAVIGVYLALRERPAAAVAAFAVSFAFKLQAVFILPMVLGLLWTGKIKPLHLPVFPLTYFAVVLPAVLCGRPLLDTVTLYFNQAASVGPGLNYNSPSVFALIKDAADAAYFSKLGIAAATAFVLLFLAYLYMNRKRTGNEAILTSFLIFAVCIPFLLPHMHDRYFFIADVVSLILAVVSPRFAAVPVLMSFASLLGYHAYLRGRYLLPMSYGSAAVLLMIVILIFRMIYLMRTRKTGKTRS
ncbi:MAG: conjugal transfer protein TraL [Oscillospiraceae bacterium]|nr:conjugal transfer protein TraL [Oscillospiraceae bacterium]